LLVNSDATRKELARKQLPERKLLVNSYAIFLGVTFELSGVDGGWVGDLG